MGSVRAREPHPHLCASRRAQTYPRAPTPGERPKWVQSHCLGGYCGCGYSVAGQKYLEDIGTGKIGTYTDAGQLKLNTRGVNQLNSLFGEGEVRTHPHPHHNPPAILLPGCARVSTRVSTASILLPGSLPRVSLLLWRCL